MKLVSVTPCWLEKQHKYGHCDGDIQFDGRGSGVTPYGRWFSREGKDSTVSDYMRTDYAALWGIMCGLDSADGYGDGRYFMDPD